MTHIAKRRNSYYIQEKIENNGKWVTKLTPLGNTKPMIWYPQLINDKAETVLPKIPDESIDLIITDPPYGIEFKGNRYLNVDYEEIFNDHTLDFLDGVGDEFYRILKPDTHCYVFTRWDAYPIMMRYFDKLKLNTVIIWDKDEGGHGMGDIIDFAPRYEMIMKFSKGRRAINGKRSPNVIRHQDVRFTKEPKIHSTQKPRGLMEFLIGKSSNPGEIVADFYAGSYTVPRAAMRTFRKSIGVELNPKIHDAGTNLLNKDLHSDPMHGFNWTNIKNVDVNMKW